MVRRTKTKRRMPAFTKAPKALVDRFSIAVTQLPGVRTRTMFSYPAAFTNDQLFACVFRDELILRLPDDDRAAARKAGWKPFEPVPGRTSAKYLVVPPSVLDRPAALAPWLRKAHAFASWRPNKKKHG